MSLQGEPPTNGLDPATIRALISKTLNSNLSVTIVSRQNAPIIPLAPSSNSNDAATVPSAISNALGRRLSRITTGWFPVTTNDGSRLISRKSRRLPNLQNSSTLDSSLRSILINSKRPRFLPALLPLPRTWNPSSAVGSKKKCRQYLHPRTYS